MVMKVVLVRAVNLSIGPFCTEFRCERFRNDGIFWDRGRESAGGGGIVQGVCCTGGGGRVLYKSLFGGSDWASGEGHIVQKRPLYNRPSKTCSKINSSGNFSIIVETSQRFPRDLPERPPRDTPSKQKYKKFTEIVAVGAGKLSSGPFCTEFRCKSNRGVGFLLQVAFSSIYARFPFDVFSINFWK